MDKPAHLNQIIERLLTAITAEETQAIYADWAATYDDDLDFFGYTAPQIGADLFDKAFGRVDAEVLDVGCGTGLVGIALSERGYGIIDGGDFSEAMLLKSAERNIYRHLLHIDLFAPLTIPTASYDGIICLGVYSSRMRDNFLPDLLRICRPNGIICISCRFNYFEDDFLPQVQAQQAAGNVEIEGVERQLYMVGQRAEAAYVVLRKPAD